MVLSKSKSASQGKEKLISCLSLKHVISFWYNVSVLQIANLLLILNPGVNSLRRIENTLVQMGSASLRFEGLYSSCGGMGRKRFGPFQFYVGSARGWGCKKVLSGVHHLAIIKPVINIFLRRMVRKQAADDCPEIRALHRHLYDSALFWLGVCPAGQKFRLSSPPSFFFQRWEFGRDWNAETLESGSSSSSLAPPSPFSSGWSCWGSMAERGPAQLELCQTLCWDGARKQWTGKFRLFGYFPPPPWIQLVS